MLQAPEIEPFIVQLSFDQKHAEKIVQVLNVDQEVNSIIKISNIGEKFLLSIQDFDPKKVRASTKHILDQLLLVLETIQYTKM